MLLHVGGVYKNYGPDRILDGVSFRLERREKVALVGRNGTGKTTLLKIIVGEEAPDSGTIQLARGARIGYLKQIDSVDRSGTVLEEAQSARKHALELADRLKVLESRLEDNPTAEELEEYATLHEHFMDAEGYEAERDIRTVLLRMGFSEDDFEKPASVLSGGERTRLALARQILEEPDLLILDEPTNHLDLQAAEWLEGWLKSYPGAVLIVSHDRAFLENIGDRFIEMRDGQVKSYPGPFEKFRKVQAEEHARLAEVAKKQQAQADKLDEFVRRFMNSQRTAQARGRLKLLNRLNEERVTAPTKDKGISGAIKATKRTGDQVFQVKIEEFGFEDRTLFSRFDWTIRSGERWGVVGENGTGKSTLIRLILGLEEMQSGDIKIGSNVEIGYFSQDADNLDPDESPLEFLIWECNLSAQDARNLLGRFLVEGDDVFRPIKTFSGGERNKISLARLTAMSPNVLILDEPTNHLDMDSREALCEILKEFTGTLVLISHDRWLLSNITRQTLDLRRTGPILYPGSYADYRRSLSAQQRDTGSKKAGPTPKPEDLKLSPREVSKEISRLEKLVVDLEESIHEEEAKLASIEGLLANPLGADIIELTTRHGEIKAEIDSLMTEWENESLRLDELRSMQGN